MADSQANPAPEPRMCRIKITDSYSNDTTGYILLRPLDGMFALTAKVAGRDFEALHYVDPESAVTALAQYLNEFFNNQYQQFKQTIADFDSGKLSFERPGFRPGETRRQRVKFIVNNKKAFEMNERLASEVHEDLASFGWPVGTLTLEFPWTSSGISAIAAGKTDSNSKCAATQPHTTDGLPPLSASSTDVSLTSCSSQQLAASSRCH